MTRIIQPPDLMTEIQELQRRIANLETQNITKLAASDGTVVLDVNNLTPAFKLLGETTFGILTNQPYAAADTAYPSTGYNFTLAKAASVLVIAQVIGQTAGGTAIFTAVRIALGSATSRQAQFNPAAYGSATLVLTAPSLAAGSYTVQIYYAMTGGAATTFQLDAAQYDVFQMGP